MTDKLPISVFIIAKNEADRIVRPIKSTRDWVDEIHVIDSGSTDGTLEVSDALGASTHFREWSGYGPQKVYGESLCRNDWILNLDADEEITPELRDEIIKLFSQDSIPCESYTLPILPFYNFQVKPHRLTAHHHPIRLYRLSHAGFKDSTVHDTVVAHEGTTGHLKGMVMHRSFRSLTHHLDKVNFYSSAQADDLYSKNRNPSFLKLLLTPPFAFIKSFFLRREFVNGLDGIIISYMYAFQRFIRIAKARERFQVERRKQLEEKSE